MYFANQSLNVAIGVLLAAILAVTLLIAMWRMKSELNFSTTEIVLWAIGICAVAGLLLTAKRALNEANWDISWIGATDSFWAITAFLAVFVAIALFFVLRRYESKLVAPGVSRVLFVLRVLVLLLVLATLLQPVLTRVWNLKHRGRLVVGFDVSESMETADRHAEPAEMLRWAQALGMLGNDSSNEILEKWIAAYEAGKNPDWGDDDADLGDSRRRHIEGVFAELAGMPRSEFVRRLLVSKPNDLLRQFDEQLDTDVQVFGMERQSVPAAELKKLLESTREKIRPAGTDAVGLLSSCIAEEDGNRIMGIVLFTDGRQTVPIDATAEASRLGSLGIPVYCVPIGSVLSPHDLSIAAVQVPQSVYLNDSARVQVTVTSSGFAGNDVTIRLQRDGIAVDQRTITAAADSFEVGFDVPTDEVGNHEYTVATDVRPGELREDNNSRDFTVSVVDNQAQVVLVEGDARWEFRYLKSALERDKRVDLSTILFRQPYLQLLNRTFLESELPEMEDLTEQLAKTDVLIIGDVRPDALPEPFWLAVEKAVADESLTLVIVPGRRYMPHQFSSPALSKLLPVTSPRPQLAERFRRSLPDAPPTVFRLEPTPVAGDLTLFDFSGPGDEEQRMTLAGLPGHPWACTGTPKPIASVWAGLKIDGVEMDPEKLAAVVHQYYGFGQVVWFGVDSTWRWRRRAGDKWHHRFWGQVVRWAARNKSAAGNDQVRMTLSDVIIDESEGVDIAVRWDPKLVLQLENAIVEVLVDPIEAAGPAWQGDEGKRDPLPLEKTTEPRKLQLEPLDGSPERYTARLTGLPAGSYRVRLNVEKSRLKLDGPIESELIVQKRLSTELANISCNRDFLQQIATLTGGRMMEPWQLSELPGLLRPEGLKENVVQEISLWDHWGILVPFFVLLTAEWIIRKMHGLP